MSESAHYESVLLPALLRVIADERRDGVAINTLQHSAEALERLTTEIARLSAENAELRKALETDRFTFRQQQDIIQGLHDERDALREALRNSSMNVIDVDEMQVVVCGLCNGDWVFGQPERHAEGCLCARPEPR